jgi:hypothetical protein
MAGAEQCTARARGECIYLGVADARRPSAEPTILREEVARDAEGSQLL